MIINPFKINSYLALLCITLSVTGCGGSEDAEPPKLAEPLPETPPAETTDVCQAQSTTVNWQALMSKDCQNLHDYSLFIEPSNPTSDPRAPGQLYQLSTELFSNYASKYRFIFIPENSTFNFSATERMEPPVGSVLVKTFALPYDTQVSGKGNEVLIETRLLIHRETGWTALTYQWQDQQANLVIAGANISHTLNNQGEQLTFDYHIPSKAECKVCHQVTTEHTSVIKPIGLKAHVLNRQVSTTQHSSINQLTLWQNNGWLNNVDLTQAPQSFPIDDESADLTSRAKGYLDINCAHCHNPHGFASISGLRLGFDVSHTTFEYGICKQPPGWDGGPDGLAYDIVPGNGEKSIVHNRQILSAAKDRMPPIGREIVHHEGTDLVKRWIDSLAPSIGNCQ
ncbi:SO2930 family diheme c-type cytochrome [Shewanella gaetbuli]|uniref:Uncharacterized protein n=1 Tax=Shewanella gaetbuli TaxID=220752 RepID=A0A9X1ZK66_9GAMM|nr:SO2930 family diheme c-type cytochrome [Shewanella gaetbuli]MCL1143909.1 hypothetical protein [Shewanella gaetbuli]